ncbi:hypothetical protein LMH66_05380 [Shewanella sp. 10N.7]|uniref:amidohydrolase family protein n=1 Tax=Shewanella sp. 10N.7 TaxID=2885093 RepID=UPI001E474436|nr:hypothetical protein [Shewanella sp. 10N.7]MCC4832057.1 hypothetical protein [Shewanella sp. 10N.7]
MNQSKLFCTLGMLLYSISLSAVASGYISYEQPKIAITNVNIIDGTGSKIKEAQTVVIEAGKIKTIMASASTTIAEDVTIIDGKGKTLIPGLIMMHEHMFYPTGKAHYTEMLHSFPKLYLAGGATTVRTAGTTSPYGDLNVRDAIRHYWACYGCYCAVFKWSRAANSKTQSASGCRKC